MRAARYRLRFFTGATLSSATYGGGLYGNETYGTQATGALTTAHHRLVPWPGGARTGPSWIYRQNDTMPPWEAQVISDDGVVDYTGLNQAVLVLTHVDRPPDEGLTFDLSIVTAPNGDQRLHHDFTDGEAGHCWHVPCCCRVGLRLGAVVDRAGRRSPHDGGHTRRSSAGMGCCPLGPG